MLPALAMRGWHCTLGPAPGKIWRGCHDKDGPLQIPEWFGMRPREPLHQETAVSESTIFCGRLRSLSYGLLRSSGFKRLLHRVCEVLLKMACQLHTKTAVHSHGSPFWCFLLAAPIVLMCDSARRICLTLCFGLVGVGCSISEECLDPTCAGRHHKIAIQKEESCRHEANDASMLMCDKLHIPLNSGLLGATACTASEHHHVEE